MSAYNSNREAVTFLSTKDQAKVIVTQDNNLTEKSPGATVNVHRSEKPWLRKAGIIS